MVRRRRCSALLKYVVPIETVRRTQTPDVQAVLGSECGVALGVAVAGGVRVGSTGDLGVLQGGEPAKELVQGLDRTRPHAAARGNVEGVGPATLDGREAEGVDRRLGDREAGPCPAEAEQRFASAPSARF